MKIRRKRRSNFYGYLGEEISRQREQPKQMPCGECTWPIRTTAGRLLWLERKERAVTGTEV